MAPSKQPRNTVSVKLACASLTPASLSELACMDCGEPLDVHQPEADSPSRLLGTCYDCGLWYLIDLPDAATGSLLLTKLPEADELKPEPPKAPSNTKSR